LAAAAAAITSVFALVPREIRAGENEVMQRSLSLSLNLPMFALMNIHFSISILGVFSFE
jgi:hypothetical protein